MFLLADTSSAGSGFTAVGCNEIWMDQICLYPFNLVSNRNVGSGSNGQRRRGEKLTGERTPAARSAALEVYGDYSGDLLVMGKSGRRAG
jgi:hypothetical protein